MIEDISNVEYASLLYDFYGELLDENKREIMNYYHEDNLSLAEIAEVLGLTRQGVHYALKKAERKLGTYEEKLGLVRKYVDGLRKLETAERIEERAQQDETIAPDVRRDIGQLVQMIREFME